jgi:hypothetical protein
MTRRGPLVGTETYSSLSTSTGSVVDARRGKRAAARHANPEALHVAGCNPPAGHRLRVLVPQHVEHIEIPRDWELDHIVECRPVELFESPRGGF